MSTIHISTDIPRSPFVPMLPALPVRVPAAPAPAVRAKPQPQKRKTTRPPKPRVPADFFDEQGYKLVRDLFSARGTCWQQDRYEKVYFFKDGSAPQWGEAAHYRCSGHTLRWANFQVLFNSLTLDLERGLRLLDMTWTKDNRTKEGCHTWEEWRDSLQGVLWRVGQHYREFTRRWGPEQAREKLALMMDATWRGEPVPIELRMMEGCPKPWLNPWVLAHHNRTSAPVHPVININNVNTVDSVDAGISTG